MSHKSWPMGDTGSHIHTKHIFTKDWMGFSGSHIHTDIHTYTHRLTMFCFRAHTVTHSDTQIYIHTHIAVSI